MPVTSFVPVQDVYVSSNYPDRNFINRPEGDVLFAGSLADEGDIYRSFLLFDISKPYHGIPPNSTIQSATLQLTVYRNDNPNKARLCLFEVLSPWDQKTVTFNTQPQVLFTGLTTVSGPPPSVLELGVGAIIRKWYDGTSPNHGFALQGMENSKRSILGLRSTRFPDSRFWPSLKVEWDLGTVSPAINDVLSGAPRTSSFINIEGKEQVTFMILNQTRGNLRGAVEITLPKGLQLTDPATDFSIPPGHHRIINYSTAASLVRIRFTEAGRGTYQVSASTRDA